MSINSDQEVVIEKLVQCDLCKIAEAKYDARSKMGPWGYMCQKCFGFYGIGLGIGKGQKLVVRAPRRNSKCSTM